MTAQLSREWLLERINSPEQFTNSEEAIEAFKLALAGMDSEPVAWKYEERVYVRGLPGDGYIWREKIEDVKPEESDPAWIRSILPLYAAPPAPVAVPDELTREEYKRRFMEEDNFDDTYRGGWKDYRAAMLKSGPVAAATVPEEKGSSLQLRNLIRKRHAEWSQKAFGNVGPVGPLKHLAKEAIEAAEAPHDLSEWADMQFLLWDAQRRAGISDAEITAAMEEKLKVNMARQWPEPKDGEPRLHIKPEQEV